jgi:hypothetical protein
MSNRSTYLSIRRQTTSCREPRPQEQNIHANNIIGVGFRWICLRNQCTVDFSACGGAAAGDDVAGRVRARFRQPVSALARWIVDKQVITFPCNSRLMLPLFQFDFHQGCLRSSAEQHSWN